MGGCPEPCGIDGWEEGIAFYLITVVVIRSRVMYMGQKDMSALMRHAGIDQLAVDLLSAQYKDSPLCFLQLKSQCQCILNRIHHCCMIPGFHSMTT